MAALTNSVNIENVVGSANLQTEVDLENLAADMEALEYNPDTFAGAIYRTETPHATTLIFRSGKLVTTGASSIQDANRAVKQTVTRLEELGIPRPASLDVSIENIVSSGDLGNQLNLTATAIGFGLTEIEYEPEQFPGLVYQLSNPDVVALLFGSGRVVITGATQPSDGQKALEFIAAELRDLDLLESS